ncbi:MAG TPA: hypothetical protein VF594_03190 [Rubricoccaceae bacterium]|jgi:hypothetical protein
MSCFATCRLVGAALAAFAAPLASAQDAFTPVPSADTVAVAAPAAVAPAAAARTAAPPFTGVDPTRTRTVLAPTARTLGRGETRLGTTLYILPTVTHGIADRVDLYGAGIFVFGGGGGGVLVFGGKGAVVDGPGFGLAVGSTFVLPFSGDSDVNGAFVALPYGVATIGDNARSVSLGVTGVVGGDFSSGDFEAGEGVLLSLGAETQVSNRVKLLADVYVPVAEGDSGVSILPGVRFFGTNVSVDLYGAFVVASGDTGGFAPIANFSYRF